MIKVKCPHCPKETNVGDEYAGKKIRCPACKEVVSVPAAPSAVRPAPAAKAPAPKAPAPIKEVSRPPVQKKRPPVEEDEEDLAEVEPEEAEAEEDEEEPRKKKNKREKKRSRGLTGQYADCPDCGAEGDAKPVGYTWWGGVLGPRILCHVKCNQCGTMYNGRSGKYNTVGIAIYTAVCLAIALPIFAGAMIFLILRFR